MNDSKNQIIAWFPIKTWVKKLAFAVGAQGLIILAKKAWTYPTNTLRAGVRHIRTSISAEKTAVFGCLTNTLAPPPIALESCWMAQKNRPV